MGGATTQQSRAPRPLGQRGLALRLVQGRETGLVHRLRRGTTVVGKGARADLRLQDSGVSRRHCEVVLQAQEHVVVRDLESTNGTFIDGRRVQVRDMPVGATLGIGGDVVLQLVHVVTADDGGPLVALTKRETDVARLVAQGLSNAAIANALKIRERTVESHLERVFKRLGIRSRVQLTRIVLDATS